MNDAGTTPAATPAPPTEDGGRPMGMDALIEGGDCPEPTGDGTEHTTNITGSETWTAATGPHYITSTIT